MKKKNFRLALIVAATVTFGLTSCYSPRRAPVDGRGSAVSDANTIERNRGLDNPSISLIDMIRQIPGVEVGGDNSIAIRGVRSMNLNNEPLFVLDGIPIGVGYDSVSGLDPQTIARISVIKDGSGVTRYGTSAANGVIMLESKKAKDDRNR